MKADHSLLSQGSPHYPHRHTFYGRQLLASSLSSGNCLNLAVSSLSPKSSPDYWLWYVFRRISFSSPPLEPKCQHTDYSCCDKYSISSAISGPILLRKQLHPTPSPSHNIKCSGCHHPLPEPRNLGWTSLLSVLKGHHPASPASPVSRLSVFLSAAPGQQDKFTSPGNLPPSLILALWKGH